MLVAHLDEATIPTFGSFGDAMGGKTLSIDAAALLDELGRIRAWLIGKPFEELVLGPRTSALLHGGRLAKVRRPLTMVEIEGIRPIGLSTELGDYFATMLDSLTRVGQHPRADGTIEVVDG
ncbi:MAG: hypothetical protein NT062_26560 [Proteobacteria bacterium]|nr:hypothetical protein [Pseudomonadota bacterium]